MTEIMNNLTPTAQERRDEWTSGFAHGDDGHYWDYAQWIAQMLWDALEHVEGLVGAEHAATPLRALVEPVAEVEGVEGKSWREVMDDTLSAGTVWPIARRFDDAGLYGVYGVTPADIPVAKRAAWIDELVAEVAAFAARSEVIVMAGQENAVVRIARIAQSRRALDTGEGEVDPGSMSIFGGVSEGRLRNLMSGSSPALERGPGGGVTAISALSWLQKRKDFLGSIWDREETSGDDGPGSSPVAPVDPSRVIFVPVARDGTMFNPGLKRAGNYHIGAKDEERNYETFDEALEALNAMPVPRWRRPNEHGNWGIVSGVAWQRIERNVDTE